MSDWFIFPCFFGVPVMDEDDEIIGSVVVGFEDCEAKVDNGTIANAEIFAGAFSVTYGRMRELTMLSDGVRRQEQQRMVQQIHDSAVQNLFSAELNIQSVEGMDGLPPQAAELLRDSRTAVAEAKSDLRKIIFRAKSEGSDAADLAAAIDGEVADHMAKGGPPVQAGMRILREPASGGREIARMVVHECLANVRKHAQANSAVVSVVADQASILVTVQDDGVGFGPQVESEGGLVENLHFGLDNIRQLVGEHGGAVDIENDPRTGGAVVFARIPIDRRGLK